MGAQPTTNPPRQGSDRVRQESGRQRVVCHVDTKAPVSLVGAELRAGWESGQSRCASRGPRLLARPWTSLPHGGGAI